MKGLAPPNIEPKSDLNRRSCRWSNTISAVVKIWCGPRNCQEKRWFKIFQSDTDLWAFEHQKKCCFGKKRDARAFFLFQFEKIIRFQDRYQMFTLAGVTLPSPENCESPEALRWSCGELSSNFPIFNGHGQIALYLKSWSVFSNLEALKSYSNSMYKTMFHTISRCF